METRIDEIADGVYRLSTLAQGITPDGFSFYQCLRWPTNRCCSTPATAGCSH